MQQSQDFDRHSKDKGKRHVPTEQGHLSPVYALRASSTALANIQQCSGWCIMLTDSCQTQNPVTYREAKILLRSRYNGDWKKDNGGYQAHLDPIWRLERAQQTSIFRLRTGHCGLRAHLKRIGISDTSLCECGQADQTPDHVLQSCPKYAERRQLTWPQGADLATKLWGSAEDLYRTAGFVASTGLKF